MVSTGKKQSGEELSDVVLPPWAKGDPHEFIRLHREVNIKYTVFIRIVAMATINFSPARGRLLFGVHLLLE